jgi:hypothetical protein
MSSRREDKRQAREKRLQREAELQAQATRRRRLGAAAAVLALLALAGVGVTLIGTAASSAASTPAAAARDRAAREDLAPLAELGKLSSPGPAGPVGPERVPVPDGPDLAAPRTPSMGASVDSIQCQGGEQVLFHIHVHLTVYVNGAPRRIPYGIGIPGAEISHTPQGPYVGAGRCFYWLHTHAADGIIHTESPVRRTYTLGNFFDECGQKLGPGGGGLGTRSRDCALQRPGVRRGPTRHPAHEPRADPARGRSPARGTGHDHIPQGL